MGNKEGTRVRSRVNGMTNDMEECEQTSSSTKLNTFTVLYGFLTAFSLMLWYKLFLPDLLIL